MARIEKTVFISYRRADHLWALIVFTWLTQKGFDAFIDYEGIGPGDFEAAILENIRSRAHFLILLTPETLVRCNEEGDWIRREIEEAMQVRRNIVPLLLDGFRFEEAKSKGHMIGALSSLPRYNGLSIESRTFEDDMRRLERQFLSVSLDAITHPASVRALSVAAKQRAAAKRAPLPEYGDSAYYRRDGVSVELTSSRLRRAIGRGATGESRSQRTTKGGIAQQSIDRSPPTASLGLIWSKLKLPEPKKLRIRWSMAARIVPTRFPTVNLFDRVADAADFEAMYALQVMTNERLRDEVGEVERVKREQRIFGPGSGPIMAAFTHSNPLGSEVSDGSYGVFYAARDRKTAIAETKYHQARFLTATGEAARQVPMRLYHVTIDAVLYDLRPDEYREAKVFRADDYELSRIVGKTLHDSGAAGLVYRSLIDDSGETVALFNPRGASNCVHAAYLVYAWDGSRFTDVYERVE